MTVCASKPVEALAARDGPALFVRGLSKVIDERPILQDLDFEVPRGRYVALLGANGAGKSTLLRILAALVPPSAGELAIFGTPLRRERADLRRQLGMIAHGSMLYRDLSALENLVFYGRLYDVAAPRARAGVLLERVGLATRAHDPVRTFSRGMVQRVAIARALMHDPELLLADEPFAGLDAPSRHTIEEMLAALHGEGRTIVLANHDIEQSLTLAEQALVLRRGRIVLDEPTRGLEAGMILQEVTAS